jgi:hypothetical protein
MSKEAADDALPMNRALRACMTDRIPVGVLYKESDRLPCLVVGIAIPTSFEDVELTINEVDHARQIRTDLYVVDQIQLERQEDGAIRTSGGKVRCWPNWSPLDEALRPTRFRYQLPD